MPPQYFRLRQADGTRDARAEGGIDEVEIAIFHACLNTV
jgi:hypothetical protein